MPLSILFRQQRCGGNGIRNARCLTEEDDQERGRGGENSVRNEISRGDGDGMEIQGTKAAKEILEACEGTVVSLAAQLEIRINPNYTPPIRIAVVGEVTMRRPRALNSSIRGHLVVTSPAEL